MTVAEIDPAPFCMIIRMLHRPSQTSAPSSLYFDAHTLVGKLPVHIGGSLIPALLPNDNDFTQVIPILDTTI